MRWHGPAEGRRMQNFQDVVVARLSPLEKGSQHVVVSR